MTKYDKMSRDDLIKEIKFLRGLYERRYIELKYFQDLHLKSLKPSKNGSLLFPIISQNKE